jgi:hypothetical protein
VEAVEWVEAVERVEGIGAVAAVRALSLLLLLAGLLPRPARGDEYPITLTVTSAPVLGVDEDADVHVEIADTLPAPRDPPRILASTGRVEDIVRLGARSFVGRYVLPAGRFPQAAILVAEVGEVPVRGFVVLRLRAAASPAFRTDPGAAVTLRIGEKEFGPQRAGRDGNVRVPVVVPPGIGYGVARSVNGFGQATEQTIDLRIPPFRRMLLAAPEAIAAGTVREVAVYAVDASGVPLDLAGIALAVSGGKPQPLGGRPGEARFLVRAPPSLRQGPLRLQAALRAEPEVIASAELPVTPGPPQRLVLRPDRPRLPLGNGSSMRVYLAAEDSFGNPTDPGEATVLADGMRVETRPAEDGRLVAIVPAPARYAGRDHLEVEAALGSAYASQRIPLGNLPFPDLHGDGLPWLMVTPRLGVVWSLRHSAGAALLLEALGRRQRWPQWLLVGLSVGVLSIDSTASDQLGVSEISLLQLPVLVLARAQRRLAGRLSVGGGVGLGAIWTDARVTSFGRDVSGDRLAPAAEAGGEAALRLPAGQVVLGLRYLAVRGGRLSSGDEIRGNTGGLVADLGYRLAW